jgi:tRNA threonylcarbamoyladenosine biosynthesis protein TsaE
MIKKIQTNSLIETKQLAQKIGSKIQGKTLILLNGELGAGKTSFTQGLALGLGIRKNVSSPTFTLMKNYVGRLPLNHIDAYRLEGHPQNLGFDELFDDNSVTVIEWPLYLIDDLPDACLKVNIEVGEGDCRNFEFIAFGDAHEALIKDIL